MDLQAGMRIVPPCFAPTIFPLARECDRHCKLTSTVSRWPLKLNGMS
jgi:hypothetical protein